MFWGVRSSSGHFIPSLSLKEVIVMAVVFELPTCIILLLLPQKISFKVASDVFISIICVCNLPVCRGFITEIVYSKFCLFNSQKIAEVVATNIAAIVTKMQLPEHRRLIL